MADVGFQTTVSVNDSGSGATWTIIPEVKEATLASRETGHVEVTPLYMATATGKQFIPTRLIDPGVVKFKVDYTPAVWARLNALIGKDHQTATVKTNWRFAAPDQDRAAATLTAQVFACDGFVTKLGEMGATREGLLEFDVEVRLSGEWAVTGGAV